MQPNAQEQQATCSTHGEHSHEHGAACGHESVPHGDHTDYLHDGHRHASHADHWDEHEEQKTS